MQGYVLYRQQRWDEALTLFAAAGESARATGDVDLLTSMLSVAGHIATKQERWDDAVRYTRESVALARQIQNRLQLGITLFPLGLALQQTGMGREAAAALAEGIQIMDELREPYLFFAGLSILLEWLVLTGHNGLTGPIVAYLHQHLTLPPDQRSELESLCQKLNLGPSPAAPDWDTVHVALTSL
ncbi:MAG: tetratricopeptide repeat protein [Chloroflexi bacterium]|nr:tetratricopeptide repeat protein [Chloroflexota bacterium]